jgi:hypothetical protein
LDLTKPQPRKKTNMKKLVLTACALTFAVSVFAQGTVVFNNRVPNAIVAPIFGPQVGDPAQTLSGNDATGFPAGTAVYTGPKLAGTTFKAELWGGPAGTTDPNSLVAATGYSVATFRTGAAAGYWTTSTDAAVIPGVGEGSVATLQVRVWDTTSGTSYANATIKGSSSLFASAPLGGVSAPPNLGFTAAGNYVGLQSFNIAGTGAVIPEPSSFALAGLGAAALLIFRRRK